MRIINEILLDYNDVLFKPKRSSLNSRKEVDLEREMTFKYSGVFWKGIPIFSANMDTSGTFETALEMSKYKMLTGIHKFYTIEDWEEFFNNFPNDRDKMDIEDFIVPSIGLKELDKLREIVELYETNEIVPKFIMLDVANGYTERFVNFVKEVRKEFPDITIIAGNVATSEGVEALVFAGADICKIGIGPGAQCETRKVAGVGIPMVSAVVECADAAHGLGAHIIADGGIKQIADFSKALGAGCFIGETKVMLTDKTKKEIKNINIGDEVYTHRFKKNKVIKKYEYFFDDDLIKINDIFSTPEHKYYVLNKKFKNIVNDENIHNYAEWVKAKDLDKDTFFLLEIDTKSLQAQNHF